MSHKSSCLHPGCWNGCLDPAWWDTHTCSLTRPWVLLDYRGWGVAVTEVTWPLKSDYWQKFALKGLLGLWGRGKPPCLWAQVTFCGVPRKWGWSPRTSLEALGLGDP